MLISMLSHASGRPTHKTYEGGREREREWDPFTVYIYVYSKRLYQWDVGVVFLYSCNKCDLNFSLIFNKIAANDSNGALVCNIPSFPKCAINTSWIHSRAQSNTIQSNAIQSNSIHLKIVKCNRCKRWRNVSMSNLCSVHSRCALHVCILYDTKFTYSIVCQTMHSKNPVKCINGAGS